LKSPVGDEKEAVHTSVNTSELKKPVIDESVFLETHQSKELEIYGLK
jgi:hypothetical protein